MVRWNEVTEQGVVGGPVMPDNYTGSPASIQQLRENVDKAGIAGSIVSNDLKSSVIFVPLLNVDPATGLPFNYGQFWKELKSRIKAKRHPTGPGSRRRFRRGHGYADLRSV